MSVHVHTPPQERLDALRQRHAVLSQRVDDALKSPGTTDFYLSQLKKQKLLIKEELEGIRRDKTANA